MKPIVEDDPDVVYQELESSCKYYFGLDVQKAVQVKRGWLNLKWKLETSSGVYLLKQYNAGRLKKYNLEDLRGALQFHQQLQAEGVACPRLLTHNGEIMQVTESGQLFVVMEYCPGYTVRPGTAKESQMYALGCQTGRMHRLLNDNAPLPYKEPQFLPPGKEARMLHWQNACKEAEADGKAWLAEIMELQLKATEAFDLTILGKVAKGLAHRDLWVDNILFEEDGLSAILDFDRLRYDYPELDLARAVISCSLQETGFQTDKVKACLEGYRKEQSFAKGRLAESLRMLWYMESEWWINKQMDRHSASPARFAEEMLWLSRNHSQLDELFGDM
ncbi:phosphotransferase enzyme family protein [Paenibacillus tepidiphilus]|uniref:phosphotransferase enzyme family protein n=1 Tax=Paenibacillus tepidiphilus TaxID=2608683 RepID=UPI00123B8C88|nr:phosphotransferase [Paenibacillus tepidiphilus]